MSESSILFGLKLAAGLITVAAAVILLVIRSRQAKSVATKSRLAKEDLKSHAERRCPHYTEKEIRAAKRVYVRPDSAQVDPSNELEYRKFASVREPIFRTVPRYLQEETRRHLLILADSGMGKTTFCLNFFDFVRTKLKQDVALVSLARSNAISAIEKVPSKRTTTLIVDALDEDPKALVNGVDRITEIMGACADFPLVIVTCRTHFFENDAAIPVRTGISRIAPRSAGRSQSYEFARLYLLPFDEDQITQFLKRSFPTFNLLSHANRRRARQMISAIPDLSARPMLLALVPELVKGKLELTELYELYEYMVQQWLLREEKWVSPATLLSVSTELAMHLSLLKQEFGVDRMSPEDVQALQLTTDELNWKHLTTRSLLNRDSEGNLKFAHRSIMEFLAVRGSLSGDKRATKLIWTDLMRELLLSYGELNPSAPKPCALFEELIQARQITKFPFADPVPAPMVRTRGELETVAMPRRSPYLSRRALPSSWLSSSVITMIAGGQILLDDRNNGLRWRLLDLTDTDVAGQLDIYRVPLSDAFRFESTDGFDHPSFAEFLILFEVQTAQGHSNFIDPSRFYWLGDKLDGGGHTVISINNQMNHPAATLIVQSARVGGVMRKMYLYSIDPYRMDRSSGSIKALEARVQRRSLDIPELLFAA